MTRASIGRKPSWGSKNQVYAEKGHTLNSALQSRLPRHRLNWQIGNSVYVAINKPLSQLLISKGTAVHTHIIQYSLHKKAYAVVGASAKGSEM